MKLNGWQRVGIIASVIGGGSLCLVGPQAAVRSYLVSRCLPLGLLLWPFGSANFFVSFWNICLRPLQVRPQDEAYWKPRAPNRGFRAIAPHT
jgi:hypothetical protein